MNRNLANIQWMTKTPAATVCDLCLQSSDNSSPCYIRIIWTETWQTYNEWLKHQLLPYVTCVFNHLSDNSSPYYIRIIWTETWQTYNEWLKHQLLPYVTCVFNHLTTAVRIISVLYEQKLGKQIMNDWNTSCYRMWLETLIIWQVNVFHKTVPWLRLVWRYFCQNISHSINKDISFWKTVDDVAFPPDHIYC